MLDVLLVILILYLVWKAGSTVNYCDLVGHEYNDNGNVFICKRCGLMKRKVRK